MRDGALKRRPFLLGCGVVVALTALSAAADQAEELARLREEAAKLRQTLEGLDSRIRALESQQRSPAARKGTEPPRDLGSETRPPIPVSPVVSLKQSWSQVQPGTPEDKVQALLGKPARVLHIDGAVVWYYVYPGIGRGSVFFNASGKVSSAQEPSLGW